MANQKTRITVDQVGIGTILKNYTLAVPSHQRDYSWTDLEVRTLLQDLAKSISDNESAYFLGTIVTIPGLSGRLEVIDGQQRLATITILLYEIHRYLRNKDKIIADDIKSFLYYTDRDTRSIMPRLRLNHADNDFFRSMISSDDLSMPDKPAIMSHKLITAAFKEVSRYIKTIVAGYDDKAHGDVLNKWINFVESSAEVIHLQVPSDGNAFKMFETLNDRGLKTTQADLIKNYLFSQAGDRLSEAEHTWSLMRGALESIQKDEQEDITVTFLRHALIVMQGFLRKGELFNAVQRIGKGSHAAVSFLKKVESLSTTYVAIFFRDHEKWANYPDAIRPAILTVNFFDIHPFRTVFLAVAAKYTPKETVKALELLISLGVRLLIASSTRTGSVEETLAKTANEVYIGKATTASALKKTLHEIIPSDEKFRKAFEIATVSNGPLARYYLRALEKVAKSELDPLYTVSDDKEIVTLEHILPRNPEKNWPQFTPDETESHWKRIGNMVLLHHKANSEMKSACWIDKKKHFKEHAYSLTAQVASEPVWNAATICRRQANLAKLALKAWPL